MGKFILTEEEKKSIRSLYGLNEQTNSLSVSGSYTAKDCDELHAFESTRKYDKKTNTDVPVPIGEMHSKVANKINEWNSKGINVKPISVDVSVNGMTVNWTVTFEQSDVNWVGFTSRGAGCNDNVDYRAGNDAIKNGPKSIIKNLTDQNKTLGKIEIVDEFKYNGGNNSFKQVFYRYTLVDKTSGSKSTPQPKTQPTQPNKSETIEKTGLNSFHDELTGKTRGISIDVSSVVFSRTNSTFKVSYSTGETKIAGMTLLFSDINREELDVRIETKMKKGLYPNLKQDEKWKGETGKYYYEFLILIK
jgi:hypothetical protein